MTHRLQLMAYGLLMAAIRENPFADCCIILKDFKWISRSQKPSFSHWKTSAGWNVTPTLPLACDERALPRLWVPQDLR